MTQYSIYSLPMPSYPRFSALRLVALDTIAVSIVSYSIVMSLGLIFARKLGYVIRPNQELLAMVCIIFIIGKYLGTSF